MRAICSKYPFHSIRIGSEAALDFSTYDGNALAAKNIQDAGVVSDSLILCAFRWPIWDVPYSEDHVGDPSLESKILSAITGREVDEDGLNRLGEVIFNVERAVVTREGRRGRESDAIPDVFYTEPTEPERGLDPELRAPGPGGELISLKGTMYDREKFEKMKDEYYQLRGWDVATGLQTKTKLEKLGLHDIIKELEQRGLVV